MTNLPQAIQISRRLGAEFASNDLVPDVIRKREHALAAKEKVFFSVCEALQKENKFQSHTDLYCSQFGKTIDQSTVQRMA